MPLWWFCCCHWCNFQNTVLRRLLFISSADTRLCQHPDWAISSTDSPTIKKYYKHKKLIKLTLCQALDVVFMAWRSCDHLYAKLSHLLNLLHSHDLVRCTIKRFDIREKKKMRTQRAWRGGWWWGFDPFGSEARLEKSSKRDG